MNCLTCGEPASAHEGFKCPTASVSAEFTGWPVLEPIKPEDIGYTTELDRDYGKALRTVNTPELFGAHIKRWHYWLDQGSKNLTAEDYPRLAPLIKDCQTEGVEPTDRHNEAIALLMPEKIFRISFKAQEYGVPWGCAYIRLKEMKKIKY